MILLQVEGFSIDENFECAFYTFLRSNQEQYGPVRQKKYVAFRFPDPT
jgi:hypothetical protein